MLTKVELRSIYKHPIHDRYQMVLSADDDSSKQLQFHVGDREGLSIENYINKVIPPRPMPHDLIGQILALTDTVKVDKIIIDERNSDVYHAKLIFNIDGQERRIDCRPSDAIAISLRLDIPIFAADFLVDVAD